jgi:hypothetical protein
MATRRGDVVMLGHGRATEGYHASALFHRATKVRVTCSVDSTPVAMRVLDRLVAAAKAAPVKSDADF